MTTTAISQLLKKLEEGDNIKLEALEDSIAPSPPFPWAIAMLASFFGVLAGVAVMVVLS